MILQKHITGNIAARLLSALFNFLIVLMVSRSLGPVVKGETTLIVTAVFIGIFGANLVGGYALVNVLHKHSLPVLLPAYIWSGFTAFTTYIFVKLLPVGLHPFAIHIALLAFIGSVTATHQVLLMCRGELTAHNVLVFATPLLNFVFLGVGLYWFQAKTISTFIYALYASASITFAISLWYLSRLPDDWKLWHFSPVVLWQILKSGFGYQLAELLQLLHLRLYFFMLSSYDESGFYRLGIYSVGISILESVWIFGRGVATINYAATVKHPSISFTLKQLRLTLIVSAIALVIIFIVPIEAYAYVFGEGFTYVKYSVKYLFPGIGLYTIVLVLGSYLMAKEQYTAMSVIHLIGIAIASGLCILWIPQYAMSGAGLAATISFAVAAIAVTAVFIKEWRKAA